MVNKYKKIYVHSRHRARGETHNFTLSFKKPIQNVEAITLSSAIMINSFHNVRPGRNTVVLGGTSYTIIEGFYTPETLKTELNTLSSGDGYTWAIDDVARAFTVSHASTFVMTGNLLEYLGFTPSDSGSNSYVSSYPWDLSGENEIFVRCRNLGIGGNLDGSEMALLGRIVMNAGLGERVVSNEETTDYHFINLKTPTSINQLEVDLVDETGEVISNNNVNWSFVLLCRIATV